MGNRVTDIYDDVFIMFDLPIAIIAFILLVFVILRILISAKESNKEFKTINHSSNRTFDDEINKVHHSKRHDDFNYDYKKGIRVKNHKKVQSNHVKKSNVNFKNHVDEKAVVGDESINNSESIINKSSEKIQFESNDLLDEYKK